jgi:hypothetical protein
VSHQRWTGSTSTIALLLSIAFAAAGAVRLGWVQYRANQRPTLRCFEPEHNFGRISASEAAVTHEFTLTNTTESAVNVLAVHVECSACMQIEMSTPVVVEPGTTITLSASLLPNSLKGRAVKRLWVYFDGNDIPLILTVAADVVPGVTKHPSMGRGSVAS